MKLCRNCRTINQENALACARCKMRNQLIDYNPEITREWQHSMHDQNKLKQLYNVCKNCGTPDYGDGGKCLQCHFPLSIKERHPGTNTNYRKVK